jgi:hypothetical protein
MASENHNPFVLPGFGQGGDTAQNPLMASMDMMRHAWENLAKSGGMDPAGMATPLSVEDLDRRISDLRAVENWLRMNLSMLSSTIQALEVQRATIATLKSFMSSAPGVDGSSSGPSPLEVALGLKPAGGSGSKGAGGRAEAKDDPSSGAGKEKSKAEDKSAAGGGASATGPADAYTANAASAAKGWWELLQKQFDALAEATTAALKNTEAMKAASLDAVGSASADSSLGKAAQGRSGSTARKASAGSRSKAPAKKSAARGTRAKTSGKT